MKFRMSDATVVDTANASQSWDEATDFDGSNYISRATGTLYKHQRLYRSRKGRYYIVHTSQWQGSQDRAEWVSNEEATRWLLAHDHEISMPQELVALIPEVSE